MWLVTHMKTLALAAGLLFALGAVADEVKFIDQETLLIRLADQKDDLVVLDVRTPVEYAAGHVPGAINISYDQLETRIGELDGARSKQVIVYCRSGRRTALALQILQANGFEQLAHLEGDMLAWQAANRPLVSGPAPATGLTPGPDPQ